MRNPRALAYIIMASLAMFSVAGCGGSRESQVANAIERYLPGIIGPADNYEVRVEGIRGATGADLVTVTGTRVRPAGSPVLDRIEIALVGVVYNPNCAGLERIARANGAVRVLSGDVAAFLDANRNLQNVEVQFQPPNQAVVRAQPQISGLELPPGAEGVEVVGALVGEGARIDYNISQVRALGLTLPEPAPELLSDAINPVVDLSGIPIVAEVAEVRVEGNAVIAEVVGRYPQ